MASIKAQVNHESVVLSAVVTRADGTVEDHGVIAYHHRNPLRRLWFRLTGKVT
jgi:hypothetical protein